MLPDGSFIWIANKRDNENLLGAENAQNMLPQEPRGLNRYDRFNNVVYLAARNPAPQVFSFWEFKGVSGAEVSTAGYAESVYQTVMRSSVRDPDNTDPKVFIVPDRFAADRLCELFPDARVESLGVDGDMIRNKPGRKRVHITNADKNRVYRERQRQQQLRLLRAINDGAPSVPMISPELAGRMGIDIDQESCDEIANTNGPHS